MAKSVLLAPQIRRLLCDFLDNWLGYRAGQVVIPGFSVAIMCQGEPLYKQAFGVANANSGATLTPEHAVCVGSQSKIMTAVLVLKLAQRGKLNLQDRVSDYLPWLLQHSDVRVRHITVEQLLSHRSGLVRDGANSDFWLLQKPFPNEVELRDLVLGSELVYPSEQQTKYSNLGYAVLGRVLEAAAGEAYTEMANKYIIKPLELKNTWVGVPRQGAPVATAHTAMNRGKYSLLPRDIPTNMFDSVTGWYSTPEDMAKIMGLLTKKPGGFLSKTYTNLLMSGNFGHWQPAQPDRGAYGLGLMNTFTDNSTVVGHSGGFIGYTSCSYVNAASKTCVSVAANYGAAPVNEMALGIHSILEHFEANAASSLPASLQKFNGAFENLLSARAVVALNKSTVSMFLGYWAPLDLADRLEAVGDKTLKISNENFLAVPGELVEYSFNKQGKATGIRYGGMAFKATGYGKNKTTAR